MGRLLVHFPGIHPIGGKALAHLSKQLVKVRMNRRSHIELHRGARLIRLHRSQVHRKRAYELIFVCNAEFFSIIFRTDEVVYSDDRPIDGAAFKRKLCKQLYQIAECIDPPFRMRAVARLSLNADARSAFSAFDSKLSRRFK